MHVQLKKKKEKKTEVRDEMNDVLVASSRLYLGAQSISHVRFETRMHRGYGGRRGSFDDEAESPGSASLRSPRR